MHFDVRCPKRVRSRTRADAAVGSEPRRKCRVESPSNRPPRLAIRFPHAGTTMSMNDDPFYEFYAEGSLSRPTLERFAATKAAIARAAGHFGLGHGPWQVADIGCGAGTQSAMWARDGHRVFGLDINSRLVELGRERALANGLSVELFVGSATELPWPDQSMHICICPELIEHVADWQSCLREAARVLKVGGLLYLSTTNKLCPRQAEFDLPFYSWYPAPLKRHYERLSVTTRRALVAHALYPAVNWFTYYALRDYLAPFGFDCHDRFDVAALAARGVVPRAVLKSIQLLPPARWLGHVCTPYTMLFAVKTGVTRAGA
jgi:ubiquinone/menaquinone biosynthesis C-methylase UbiE